MGCERPTCQENDIHRDHARCWDGSDMKSGQLELNEPHIRGIGIFKYLRQQNFSITCKEFEKPPQQRIALR